MPVQKYIASTSGTLVAAAGTSPFFAIQGSANKVVKVTKINVDAPTLTLIEYLNVVARKTSTAVSGGTATALTAVPLDSSHSASTASLVNVYTAAPTPGTAVGVISSERALGQAAVAAAAGLPVDDMVIKVGDGVILRGIAEGLSLSFAAAPASAVTLTIEVEWEEE